MLLRLLLSLLLICAAPVAALAHAGCATVADEPVAHAHHHDHAMPAPADSDGCCDVLCVNLCLAATALPPVSLSLAVCASAEAPRPALAGRMPVPLPEMLLRPPRTLSS
ncbi:hypothetical protein A167_02644 [Alcanivorax sp. S71-1-4]|uniref:hypothetical protein n=1 Tax=Alcanivorax sp. S71-1-4 TaxID=1177159 RepID=UPI00135996B6|nr:hypothetical protein [Alcanivorax sp. S71-1-4]KAF0808256.1 hypothetical protein A167_02644 [Alcanivorax sp. S71-1-4]